MPASTRSSLQPVDKNAQRVPPTTPGTKMRHLKAELESKETENEALRGNIDDLVKALGKIDLVKSEAASGADNISSSNNNNNNNTKSSKKNSCPVVPAKTAYKFFCESISKKKQESTNMQQLWKESAPEIRQKYVLLAQADKARYQSEMEAYNKEQKALDMYYEKKKQEQAMAFYEAHLEAQAALEKAQDEASAKGKKKKAAKDPDAPKRCTSSYMFFAQEMRAEVVKKNPEASVTDVSKILGEMWKELDKTKTGKGGAKKYEDMAAQDRERYGEEKAVYDAMLQERKEMAEREKEARFEQEKKEAMELMETQNAVQMEHISLANTGMDNMSVISDMSGTKATTKKKKDPNAPKRALTAYNCFVSENRSKIKAKMPETATNAEVFAEVGKQWKELSDKKKEKYNKMAAKDQERYAKEMEQYNAKNNANK